MVHIMRSGCEKQIATQLDKAKIKYVYEPCVLAYKLNKKYTPDFAIEGKSWFLESKGRFVSSDRTKLLAVREQNPGIEIRLVFQRNNKLSKTSKTRYSEWAKKHKFKYALDKIPKQWLKSGVNKNG